MIDLSLSRLEGLLARMVKATARNAQGALPATEAALQNVASDSGGDGLDDLLADIRGYVDELRNGVVNLKLASTRQGQALRMNGHDGPIIQVVIGPNAR